MAFIEENMHLLAGAAAGGFGSLGNVGNRAPRLWSYTTVDAVTTVRGATYFDNSIFAKNARKGDIVLLISFDGADFETNSARVIDAAQWMVVLSADGTSVDLSDGSSIGISNT